MNRCLNRMLLRSIRQSLGRFLAILGIVALGVGFFAGLKSSQPDLLHSLEDYYGRTRFYDFRLLSSLGLTESDAEAFRGLYGVEAAEGACFADAWASLGDGDEKVWHFEILTEAVDVPELTAGRMPEGPGECLGDNRAFSEKDLGKTLRLSDGNSKDTLSHFGERSFVLTGLARSPRYISVDRGSSELGSGKPEGFVLIPPAAFADGVYHELLLRCELPGALYSEEYNDARRRMRPAVETLLNRRAVLRREELLREAEEELQKARKELEEGWSEYRLGKRKSESELASALEKLNAAQKQWDDGYMSVVLGEARARRTETKAKADLAELTEKQTALTAKSTELLQRSLSLQGRRAVLEAEKITAETGRLYREPQSAQLTLLYTRLLLLQLDPAGNADEITRIQAEIDRLQGELDSAREQYDAETAEEAARREAELAQLDAESDALALEQAAVAEELTALTAKQMELNMTLSAMPATWDQLVYARMELEDSYPQLRKGWDDYYEGKKKAEQELAEALKKLEDGECELQEAEAELKDALQPELYVLDRNSNAGYVTFENDSAIVDAVAGPFPVFFSLVAALVCVTTMTRMVNEERTQIGTLKAMGYSSGSVMAKYLSYAGLSSFLGCVIGFFAGSTGLPYIIWHAYNILYQYSDLLFRFSPLMFAGCMAVAVAGSLGVTWYACRSALAEKPAELIRPKAPAVGKRVLLERLPLVWEHLPFLGKLSIRNAFRYPSRVLMMILGISGCTALMVAGFGVRDSIAQVAEYQYSEIALYDLSVNLSKGADIEAVFGDAGTDRGPDPVAAAEADAGTGEDAGTGTAAGKAAAPERTVVTARREEVTLLSGERQKDTELIAGEAESLPAVLDLHRKDGTGIPFPARGEIVITEKLSEDLGLREGDVVKVRLGDGKELSLTVTGVCAYYVGHAVFASLESLGNPAVNYALVRAGEGEDPGRLAAALRSREGVQYVSLTRTEREIMETSMASLDLLVLMLVLCSGALAFITLYNLTNINLMERIREVATVKVLGFTPSETARYILDENLLLSFLGAGAGLLLGKLLHRFIMDAVQVEYMTFDIRIVPLSYALSFTVTVVFAVLTNLFMRGKLRRVHMAESLKSVE